MERVLFDILDAIGQGFSAAEIICNTSGRSWLPERLYGAIRAGSCSDWVNGETLLVRSMEAEPERAAPQPFTAPLWP